MTRAAPPMPLATGLAPVVAALVLAAEQEAAGIRAAGRDRARALMAVSEAKATLQLGEAKRAGVRAADAVAAGEHAATRRRAREVVLAAHRDAVDSLRASVLAGLSSRLDTAEGEVLTHYLARLVEAKAGAPATIATSGAGEWSAVAWSAAGRAAIDLGTVVDQMMSVFGNEVEQLWR